MQEELENFKVAKQNLKTARVAYDKSLDKLRKVCTHQKIAQCDYQSNDYCYDPEKRLCEICGLTEDEKYGRYEILTCEYVKNVSRTNLFKLRDLVIN